MITEFIRNFYREIGKQTPSWKYEDLKHTPWLYGSEYLEELALAAKDEEDLRKVLMHMVRHKTGEIESYKEVEIICHKMRNKLRRGSND